MEETPKYLLERAKLLCDEHVQKFKETFELIQFDEYSYHECMVQDDDSWVDVNELDISTANSRASVSPYELDDEYVRFHVFKFENYVLCKYHNGTWSLIPPASQTAITNMDAYEAFEQLKLVHRMVMNANKRPT